MSEHRVTISSVPSGTVTAVCSCGQWRYDGLDDGDMADAQLRRAIDAHHREADAHS